SCFKVLLAADEIQHFILDRIKQQSIYREITPLNIFPRITGKADFVGMAAIGITYIAAKGRNLYAGFVTVPEREFLILGFSRAVFIFPGLFRGRKRDQNDPKLRAHSISLRKNT